MKFESLVAGRGGFEPPLADPESAVLPLDDLPITHYYIINLFFVNTYILKIFLCLYTKLCQVFVKSLQKIILKIYKGLDKYFMMFFVIIKTIKDFPNFYPSKIYIRRIYLKI